MSGRRVAVLYGLLVLAMIAAYGCTSAEKAQIPFQTARDLDLKGEYESALSLYQQEIERPESKLKDLALFRIGRCYYELGQTDKAVATFKSLIATYPDSKWATEATTELDWIAKHPTPLQPPAEVKPAASEAKPAPAAETKTQAGTQTK